jgi:tryptophan-rich sensory protein
MLPRWRLQPSVCLQTWSLLYALMGAASYLVYQVRGVDRQRDIDRLPHLSGPMSGE